MRGQVESPSKAAVPARPWHGGDTQGRARPGSAPAWPGHAVELLPPSHAWCTSQAPSQLGSCYALHMSSTREPCFTPAGTLYLFPSLQRVSIAQASGPADVSRVCLQLLICSICMSGWFPLCPAGQRTCSLSLPYFAVIYRSSKGQGRGSDTLMLRLTLVKSYWCGYSHSCSPPPSSFNFCSVTVLGGTTE